nr:N-6 DNA methylase [Rubripirellula obstinata]
MKFAHELSADKLRGGFYTPDNLADDCLKRVRRLLGDRSKIDLLEPSAGDGAFVRAVGRAIDRSDFENVRVTGIELNEGEAAKAKTALSDINASGSIHNCSFFDWANSSECLFDCIVGNPPFVRYQFVKPSDRVAADELLASAGLSFDGVSNLWIPFVVGSLNLLKPDGSFCFVLPSELLTIKSAGLVRSELIRHCDSLSVDFYPPGTFENILQGIIVLAGKKTRRIKSGCEVEFSDRGTRDSGSWNHFVSDSKNNWTKYLLSPALLTSYNAASELPGIATLGTVADISVSNVTGANKFFTVTGDTVENFELEAWAIPLLARTADCEGLAFLAKDHRRAVDAGQRAYLLNFAANKPDPMSFAKSREYIEAAESEKIHERYKCRIRNPWYRLHDVRAGKLMLTKRAHQFHRLLLNSTKAMTTDTVYRGSIKPIFARSEKDLIAGFHNSLTILSTELEGRSYGGGVLELIPSEIKRILIPVVQLKHEFSALDKVCRSAGGQRDTEDLLISATDKLLASNYSELKELMPDMESARRLLRDRRWNASS